MSKPTQLWPGTRMRAFFRSIFQGEPGVDNELAGRLAEVCERHINRMLVWDAEPPATRVGPASRHQGAQATPTPPSAAMTEAGAPWPEHEPEREKTPELASKQARPTAVTTPFDPYAFSVVVILARNGPGALLDRLCEIDCPANLHLLAEAQHVAVDRSISDLADLRAAIVVGAKQRLADRSAAAS